MWSDYSLTIFYLNDMTVDPKRIPNYSHSEETHNSLTHFAGFLFGLAISILFVVYQIKYNLPFSKTYPFYIYAFFMLLMFFNSSFYHSRKFGSKVKAITRVIDHCDIYLFVAATYTPICIHGIQNEQLALIILVTEWVFALIGVILNIIDMNHKVLKYISFAIYLFAGWTIIFFYPFNLGLNFKAFLFILFGGITYTLGALLYAIGSKKHWFHTIFHLFVLAAAVLQFVGIWHIFLNM